LNTPFSTEQFLAVFSEYNAAIWPVQIGAFIAGLFAVAALWLKSLHAARVILLVLALMWVWNGVGYHFLFFSAINPAAKLFAALFVLQGIALATCAIGTQRVSFLISHDFSSRAGLSVIGFAMLIYPILGWLAGHGSIRSACSCSRAVPQWCGSRSSLCSGQLSDLRLHFNSESLRTWRFPLRALFLLAHSSFNQFDGGARMVQTLPRCNRRSSER
jgi:uncharacterized membrane protein